MDKIIIVIVNWNTKDLLKKCLKSIEKNFPQKNAKVFVVDNASTDKSVEMVKKIFPEVKVIANKQNLGFATANNQVLKKADADYLLILNPDTQITEGSLEALIKFLKQNPQYGACGPMLLNSDGSIQKKGYYHRLPSLVQAILFYTEASKISFKNNSLVKKFWEDDLNTKVSQEVDQIPGACLLSTRKVLKKVGFFDEDYPLWFEDVDLCFKMQKKGFKLALVPESRIYHLGGGSFNKWTDEKSKQVRFYQSMFIFFDKHKSPLEKVLIRLIIISNLIYLIFSKGLKQFFAPTQNREEFIKKRWEVLKCLLV